MNLLKTTLLLMLAWNQMIISSEPLLPDFNRGIANFLARLQGEPTANSRSQDRPIPLPPLEPPLSLTLQSQKPGEKAAREKQDPSRLKLSPAQFDHAYLNTLSEQQRSGVRELIITPPEEAAMRIYRELPEYFFEARKYFPNLTTLTINANTEKLSEQDRQAIIKWQPSPFDVQASNFIGVFIKPDSVSISFNK